MLLAVKFFVVGWMFLVLGLFVLLALPTSGSFASVVPPIAFECRSVLLPYFTANSVY
jgi:hypothetical protein